MLLSIIFEQSREDTHSTKSHIENILQLLESFKSIFSKPDRANSPVRDGKSSRRWSFVSR